LRQEKSGKPAPDFCPCPTLLRRCLWSDHFVGAKKVHRDRLMNDRSAEKRERQNKWNLSCSFPEKQKKYLFFGKKRIFIHLNSKKRNFFSANVEGSFGVRNGGSFKRAFIFSNKEVTKRYNRQSNTDLIQKGHRFYIQQ
jgi:hypothetical protein